ncbi:MAG: hypothetical protein IV085_09435 [Thiobacillus sp.]|nr:hypothetical protein [Thiobacillus sp.]
MVGRPAGGLAIIEVSARTIFSTGAARQAQRDARCVQIPWKQWQLPLLFGCKNTRWQACVQRRESMSERAAITASAVGHGLPTISVDGNDVEAVRAQARQAIAAIQRGPRFLELVTTVRGAMSNPTIRPMSMLECWRRGGRARPWRI